MKKNNNDDQFFKTSEIFISDNDEILEDGNDYKLESENLKNSEILQNKNSENKNLFKEIFIPSKSDSTLQKIRKISATTFSIVFFVAGGLCINKILEKNDSPVLQDDTPPPSPNYIQKGNASYNILLADKDNDDTTLQSPQMLPQFVETYAQNSDLIGHVRIGDTRLNYDVYQTDDNDYYLKHDRFGNPSHEGEIFADFKSQFSIDKVPDNTTLYGHNIIGGSCFAMIMRYYPHYYGSSSSLEFYRKYPTINFDTLYEEGEYKIFAGFLTDTDPSDPYVYEYFKNTSFENRAEFYSFIVNIMDRSLFYNSEIDLKYGDELLTMSTCYYPFGKENMDSRFVIFARKVRPGESSEVDVSKIYENDNPLMFKKWYSYYRTSWDGRNWDTKNLLGFDEWLLENPDPNPFNDQLFGLEPNGVPSD